MSPHDQFVNLCESYGNHPDQGLKTCKKALQKNPKSLVHQLAQAWFLQQLYRDEEAYQTCDKIDVTSKEWQEPELVAEYQEILMQCQRELDLDRAACSAKTSILWKDQLERYGRSNGREIRQAMFKAALSHNQWDVLQQLFASLQKDFPKLPQYHFAWIALSQLQAERSSGDPKTAQLSQMLAYRSLKGAVSNTLEDKETPRKVTSTQQLRLLAYVYNKQAQNEELLSVLNNPMIGIESSVGKGDTEFTRAKLELLAKKEDWPQIAAFCSKRLKELLSEKAKSNANDHVVSSSAWADDWTIWKHLVVSASKLESSSEDTDVLALTEKFLQLDPRSRNAGRARVHFYSLKDQNSLLSGCLKYWDAQADRRACFEDLRKYLRELPVQDQQSFLLSVDSVSNELANLSMDDGSPKGKLRIDRTINILKVDYFFNVTKAPDAPGNDQAVSRVLKRALTFYQNLAKSTTPDADEACILAILILVDLYRKANPQTSDKYLLVALYLAESLRAYSPTNYQANLLYTRISQSLGLHMLAAELFDTDLRLKEIQQDTLGHLPGTRISTSHPFENKLPTVRKTKGHNQDPLLGLSRAIDWNDYAARNVVSLLSKDLSILPYDKLAEFAAFKDRIEHSFSRAMLLIEKRRVARLTDCMPAGLEELPIRLRDANSDNRDFSVFPNYGYDAKSGFERATQLGNRPGMYWLAHSTMNDLCQTVLASKAPEAFSRRLQEAATYLIEHADTKTTELTAAELSMTEGWEILNRLSCFLLLGAGSEFAAKDFKKEMRALAAWISATLPEKLLGGSEPCPPQLLSWSYLHPRYLTLEFAKAVEAFTDACTKASKTKGHHAAASVQAAIIKDIRAASKTAAERVRSDSRAFVAQIKGKRLEDLAAGEGGDGADVMKIVADLLGPVKMRAFGTKVLENMVESVEGLSRVKIGL